MFVFHMTPEDVVGIVILAAILIAFIVEGIIYFVSNTVDKIKNKRKKNKENIDIRKR